MRQDLIIGLVASALIHLGFFAGGEVFRHHPSPQPAKEEIPTIEVFTLPPLEPEEPEIVDHNAQSDNDAPAESLAPSLMDIPSAIVDPTAFVQKMQPPPPPGMDKPVGIITIPTTRPGASVSKGMGNLFDLASLDQKPVPQFRVRPVYPSDMRQAGVSGQVVVNLLIDTQGNVRNASVVSSTNPGFESAAIQAAMKWKFKPGKKGGVAVNTKNVHLPLLFNINDTR